MLTRIVVANQGEARFYDALGFAHPLKLVGTLINPAAHLRDQDLDADRSTAGENTTRRHTTQLFARRVALELERARRAGRVGRLVLIAAPTFLGELRGALTAAVAPRVVATIAKDVVDHPEADLRRYLPRATFTDSTGFVPARRATGTRGR